MLENLSISKLFNFNENIFQTINNYKIIVEA